MNKNTLNPYGHGYQKPSADDIKQLINESGYTGKQIAELCGVNPRRVREWQSGEKTPEYSAWRLLLALLGKVQVEALPYGPKRFINLYINESGQLAASNEAHQVSGQIIGQAAINMPVNVQNEQAHLNSIVKEVKNADQVVAEFGKTAALLFEKSGGLSPLFK